MFHKRPGFILPISAALLLFGNACLAAPVIYRISGDITLFTDEGSGIDTAGLDGASFVAELIVDTEAAPVSTFSTATSERAAYSTTSASIRFFDRPSLPPLTLAFGSEVEAINYFVPGTFTDRVNLQSELPEIVGKIDEKILGWGERGLVMPLDFFAGNGLPPVPVFSEFDVVSQTVTGFIHDENNDGNFDTLNGDTLYTVSNGLVTASRGVSCDIQLSQTLYVDGDTVTAATFRLANPGAEAVAVELKSWLEGPGFDPISLINAGADGLLDLQPGFDADIGPLPLATVTPGFPRGRYEWNCRLIDPVTGEIRATDVNFFDIE
jgi:hypothetical protein